MKPLLPQTGIGLRHPHFEEMLEQRPSVGWLEIHSENFFYSGSYPGQVLNELMRDYPISLHGVGLSLGSIDPLDSKHLSQLKALVDRVQPLFVSEHLSWSSVNGQFFNDLLPLPYSEESLEHFCQRVDQTQQILGRQLLIENPSAYISFDHSPIPEWEFLNQLVQKTQCGLLLDLNNIYVSGFNLGFDPYHYLNHLNTQAVREIHLAGFTHQKSAEGEVYIDTHSCPVHSGVWDLYDYYLKNFNQPHTLIEWDTQLPTLDTLLHEAQLADRRLRQFAKGVRHAS